MQTHPDVAGSHHASSADKFKRISEAYAIIGNERERRRYDYEISESGIRDLRNRTATSRGSGGRGGGTGSASFGAALPRNIFIGSLLGIVGVTMLRMVLPSKDDESENISRTGHKKLVEAWHNPGTGRWETPKPWDPMYQQLQPTLHLVPREKVHDSKRR